MPSSPAQTGAVTEPELSRAARQDVTRVASLPDVHAAMAWFRSHTRDITDEQLELTKIPAPPFGEHERAEWLRRRFTELGLTDVHIAEALKAADIKTQMPILFVGNVGEEGEGDVRGMRHLFGESDWSDQIQYALILDGAGTDSIVTQALGSKRFQITVNGPGGHSWS